MIHIKQIRSDIAGPIIFQENNSLNSNIALSWNNTTNTFTIQGKTSDSTTNSLDIKDSLGNSYFILRNDKKIFYRDGNEGEGKIFISDATGGISWIPVSGDITISGSGVVTLNTTNLLNKTLNGFALVSTGIVTSTDSILNAFGKLQYQISNFVSGVSSVNGFSGVVTLSTTDINEGTNLYYTNARAIASTLTGYVSGSGIITSSDSILTAIQKLNGNITNAMTGVSSVNSQTGTVVLTTTHINEGTNLYYTNARAISSTLTGFTSGIGSITSVDTVLSAIQKLDGNVTTLVPYIGASTNVNLNDRQFTNVSKIGIGTASPTYDFEMKKSVVGALTLNVVNTNTDGFSFVGATNDTGTAYVTLGVFNSSGGVGSLYNNNTAWVSFQSTTACGIINEVVGPIIFATTTYGPAGEAMRIGDNKNVSISGAATGKIATPLALLHLGAGNTSFPQILLPTSQVPTAPPDGSIWRESNTTTGLKIRINGVTETFNFGTGTGSVISVLGTANRITSTGGFSPTIDISSSYIGQTSITTLGTIATGTWNGAVISDAYISSSAIWNNKQNALSGTGFVKISGTTISYDNSTYLTTISGITAGGDLSGTYSNPTVLNSAVIGKVLTGLNITGSSILNTDSILVAFGKLQNQINGVLGGAIYQGTYNATTNTPSLIDGTGIKGNYYVVDVSGVRNFGSGNIDFNVGDWAIYNGTIWQKVDNTDAVTSVNGFIGAVNLTTTNITEGANLYYTNARAITSTLTGYVSGSGTITSSDTVLTAIQKLNGNITNFVPYTNATTDINLNNRGISNISTLSINAATTASSQIFLTSGTISPTTKVNGMIWHDSVADGIVFYNTGAVTYHQTWTDSTTKGTVGISNSGRVQGFLLGTTTNHDLNLFANNVFGQFTLKKNGSTLVNLISAIPTSSLTVAGGAFTKAFSVRDNADVFDIFSVSRTVTTGAVTNFSFINPNNTGQTASTAIPSLLYNGGSRTWATGSFTTQIEKDWGGTIYNFAGPSTITDSFANYFRINTAGANATITNNWAIGTNGNVFITGSLRIVDGTQGNTKVLTSDANGLASWQTITPGTIYTFSTGLTNTSNTITNNLLTGLSGGQTIIGGTQVGDGLIYRSTTANGTLSSAAHTFTGGNNGATILATLFNNSNINLGNAITTNQRLIRIGQDTATLDFGSLIGTTSQGAIYLSQSTPSSSNFSLTGNTTTTILNAVDSVDINVSAISRLLIRGATVTGTDTTFRLSQTATTGQTASTAIPGFLYIGGSRQWNAGDFATQKENDWQPTTYTATASTTITNAFGNYFNAPIIGLNVSIVDNWAIGTNGNVFINGTLKITDGTQGAGKVLTSDANGLASWVTPSGGGTGWALTGNSIASTDFLGSTNSQNLTFKTNNITRATINGSNGYFKINPSSLATSEPIKIQLGSEKILVGDIQQNQAVTFIEFFKGNGSGSAIALRTSIGFLGTTELNQSVNMDYTTGDHLYYNSALPAAWSYLSHTNDIFGIQYVPANNPNTSIYTNYGCRPFYVEAINQPSTGKGINGFSKIHAANLRLYNSIDTSTTAGTGAEISNINGEVDILTGNGLSNFKFGLNGLKITQSNSNLILDRIGSSPTIDNSIIYFKTGATFDAYIGTSRPNGTGIFTGVTANSLCIDSGASNMFLGNDTVGAKISILSNGNVGISNLSPTALLHLGAGSTTMQPLRLTSGPLATGGNIIAGGIEFLTDKLFVTITTGTSRKELTLNDDALITDCVPFVTANGRLTNNTEFTFNSTTKALKVRRERRTVVVAQSANPAINTDLADVVSITGLAQNITSLTTNLTGTPILNELLEIQFTDNGTSRTITFGASFKGITSITTTINIPFKTFWQWDATTTQWEYIGSSVVIGITRNINNISTNTSLANVNSVDQIYNCSGTITATLPTAINNTNMYTIKNVSTGVITINTTSSQTIDDGLTATLIIKDASISLISDGSNWKII